MVTVSSTFKSSMLNPIAFDEEYDRELLEGSFQALRHHQQLEIVDDEEEYQRALRIITDGLTVPDYATLSIQNLFRYVFPNGKFYIAQCLFDFGYPTSSNRGASYDRKYYFHIAGFAELKVDLGNTFMRSETKTDKIVGRFFGNDIDFDGTAKFNDKYYLVSDKKETLESCFDRQFFNTIAKYDNLMLRVKQKQLYITFDTDFHVGHSRIVEDVLTNCNFLAS
ncbi:MAG TPA: hypothetical protein VFZ42_10240 [Chitinophagaceae bacterium]